METDMTNPSVKNVSPADLEAALARTLQQLTGFESCTVTVQALEFDDRAASGERITLRMKAALGVLPSDGVPF